MFETNPAKVKCGCGSDQFHVVAERRTREWEEGRPFTQVDAHTICVKCSAMVFRTALSLDAAATQPGAISITIPGPIADGRLIEIAKL